MGARTTAATVGVILVSLVATARGEPQVLSVDYVKAHLAELHGKTVRLQGEVNNCQSLTCSICTSGADNAVCLPLDLYSDRAGQQLTEELYRFATITVDAHVDATCELGYDPSRSKGPAPNEILVCTDRGMALEEARVVSVDKRRAATDGRFDMYSGYPLRLATAAESAPIVEAWRAQQQRLHQDDPPREVQVLIESPEGRLDYDAGFRLCVCRDDSCAGKWPSKSGQFTASPGNPYWCMRAEAYATGWDFSY